MYGLSASALTSSSASGKCADTWPGLWPGVAITPIGVEKNPPDPPPPKYPVTAPDSILSSWSDVTSTLWYTATVDPDDAVPRATSSPVDTDDSASRCDVQLSSSWSSSVIDSDSPVVASSSDH